MTDPHFLLVEAVMALHDHALAEFGGVPGVKDANALESALMRPQNRLAYSDPDALDLFDLASIYADAIAANHAFNDGNKRTAWAAAVLFLLRNGINLDIPPSDAANTMVALATHTIDDTAFAHWLRAHERPA